MSKNSYYDETSKVYDWGISKLPNFQSKQGVRNSFRVILSYRILSKTTVVKNSILKLQINRKCQNCKQSLTEVPLL